MSKDALVTEVAERLHIPKTEAKDAIEAVAGAIHTLASRGMDIRLPPLGTFKQVHKPARTVRSPATGEPVDVPAHDKITFKASKPKA